MNECDAYPVRAVEWPSYKHAMAWEMVCPDSHERGLLHFLTRPTWNKDKPFATYLFCDLCSCFWKITKRGLS